MCERTYVACGGCDAPVAGNVRSVSRCYSAETYYESLDEDGDRDGANDEYGDSEPTGDSEFSHYECSACGWNGGSLDMECTSDECDCAECEPEIDNYTDPDQVVTLVRTTDRRVTNDPDWPVEVQRLVLDRSIHFVPMRRERAAEIDGEVDFTIGMNTDGYTSNPERPCLHWNTDPQLADWIIEQLSIPEPEDELVPAHVPGQLELEGGSHVGQ